jgi:ornithine carbamoyltransferase
MDINNNSFYIKYLISNLVLINDWIEKFGIVNDKKIADFSDKIANEINSIMNRMGEMGIDVDEIHNESYDIDKNIRDFKIKKILNDERN